MVDHNSNGKKGVKVQKIHLHILNINKFYGYQEKQCKVVFQLQRDDICLTYDL